MKPTMRGLLALVWALVISGCLAPGAPNNQGLHDWLNREKPAQFSVDAVSDQSVLPTNSLSSVQLTGSCDSITALPLEVEIESPVLTSKNLAPCIDGRWTSSSWNWTAVEDGTIPLALTLRDSAGGSSRRIAFSVIKDTVAPVLTLSAPLPETVGTNEATVTLTTSESVTFSLSASSFTLSTTQNARCQPPLVSSIGSPSRTITLRGCTGYGQVTLSVAEGSAQDAAGNRSGAASATTSLQVLSPLPSNPTLWTQILRDGYLPGSQKSEIIARTFEAPFDALEVLLQDTGLSVSQLSELASRLTAIADASIEGSIQSDEAMSLLVQLALRPDSGPISIPFELLLPMHLVKLQGSSSFFVGPHAGNYRDALAQIASLGTRLLARDVRTSDLSSWIGDPEMDVRRYQALVFLCHEFAIERVPSAQVGVASGYSCVFNVGRDPNLNVSLIFDLSGMDLTTSAPVVLPDFALLEFKWSGVLAPGVDLRSRNFQQGCSQDLCILDFSSADLRGARFDGANLRDSRFTAANLRGATFDGAVLLDASFSTSRLENVDFTLENLTGVDFWDTDLSETRLDLADLSRANLTGARLPPNLLLGSTSGAEVRFSYDSSLSEEQNLAGFLNLQEQVESSLPRLVTSELTLWVDGLPTATRSED
jgi:hypothetical protein